MLKADHLYCVAIVKTASPQKSALHFSQLANADIARGPITGLYDTLSHSWYCFDQFADLLEQARLLVPFVKPSYMRFDPSLDLDLDQALDLCEACGLDTVETCERVPRRDELTRLDWYRVERYDLGYGFCIVTPDKRGYDIVGMVGYITRADLKDRLNSIAQFHPVLAASAWIPIHPDDMKPCPALYTVDPDQITPYVETVADRIDEILTDGTIMEEQAYNAKHHESSAFSLFCIASQVNTLADLLAVMTNMGAVPSNFLEELAAEDDQDYLDPSELLEDIGATYSAILNEALVKSGRLVEGTRHGVGWDENGEYSDLVIIDSDYTGLSAE